MTGTGGQAYKRDIGRLLPLLLLLLLGPNAVVLLPALVMR